MTKLRVLARCMLLVLVMLAPDAMAQRHSGGGAGSVGGVHEADGRRTGGGSEGAGSYGSQGWRGWGRSHASRR